jgi:hypothetical protein
MMRTQKDDLAFGAKSEEATLPILQNLVGSPLVKTNDFHPMDYTNEGMTIFVELKTRRVKHNQYPTALIGHNKVRFCFDPNVSYYFCFSYLDGLYYIKYDPALFATFRVEEDYLRSERIGCETRPQRIVHIPHTYLLPVS